MRNRRILALGGLAALVLGIVWSAWTWWPPILRFRLRQVDARTERVMLEYLDRKRDLASSARTLADLWGASFSIAEHLPPVGQTARIVDPGPGALGERAADPRLKHLLDSAARLMTFRGRGWTMYEVERDSS